MADLDLTETEEQYVEAVKRLKHPSSEDIASEVGVAQSTARDYLADIDIIEYKRSEGYYLTKQVTVEGESPHQYRKEVPDGLIDDLQGGGLTFEDFRQEYDLGREGARDTLEELEERGYPVDYREIGATDTRLWYLEDEREKTYSLGDDDGVYRFGLISDTHLGSAEEHLRELNDFYDKLVDRDIHHVFHAGDISDGWKVYKHHHQQLKDEAVGWERLREYVVDNYPERDGVQTHFITGNHDYKLWKRSGMYFGQEIDERRDDLNWLGPMEATIHFHRDVDLELIHPSGGTPYTLGYRAQTLYRERDPENRPTIGAIGHLHDRLWGHAEGVEAFYTGCWQGPTPYTKRKGLPTNIGGWIVEMQIKDGHVERFSTDWIDYPTRDSGNDYTTTDLEEL